MKYFYARNKDGQLVLNEFVTGDEIRQRLYWNDHTAYYLTKKDNILIPFNMISVSDVYGGEQS